MQIVLGDNAIDLFAKPASGSYELMFEIFYAPVGVRGRGG